MADCSATAASEAIYDLMFVNSRGTKIPLGTGASGVCYTSYTTPGKTVAAHDATVIVFGSKDKFGMFQTTTVHYNEYTLPGTTVTTPHSWVLSGFNVEAKGKIKVWWSDNGHLMVTIYDVYSTLTGTDGDSGRAFRAPLYSGPVGWAVMPSLQGGGMPAANHPNWRMCMGGWWSALQASCSSTSCVDQYGNPPGGTMYWWNKWTGTDAKYVHNGTTPGRLDGPETWDLGEVETDENTQVYIYARGVRGQCGSTRFDAKDGAVQALGFAVPLPSLCPPTITRIETDRDICEEKVWADLRIEVPELGGHTGVQLLVESSIHSDFSNASTVSTVVNTAGTVKMRFNDLVPRTRYYFRAKLTTGKVESEWSTVVDALMPYMPKPEWVVPFLTDDECETLTEGDCLEELTEEKIKPLQCEEYRSRM